MKQSSVSAFLSFLRRQESSSFISVTILQYHLDLSFDTLHTTDTIVDDDNLTSTREFIPDRLCYHRVTPFTDKCLDRFLLFRRSREYGYLFEA